MPLGKKPGWVLLITHDPEQSMQNSKLGRTVLITCDVTTLLLKVCELVFAIRDKTLLLSCEIENKCTFLLSLDMNKTCTTFFKRPSQSKVASFFFPNCIWIAIHNYVGWPNYISDIGGKRFWYLVMKKCLQTVQNAKQCSYCQYTEIVIVSHTA